MQTPWEPNTADTAPRRIPRWTLAVGSSSALQGLGVVLAALEPGHISREVGLKGPVGFLARKGSRGESSALTANALIPDERPEPKI